MPDIALYYPYTRVRDDTWLKAAALYLQRLALVAPRQYAPLETVTARTLREELGFLVDIDPDVAARRVGEDFLRLVVRDHDALRSRYAWDAAEFPPELAADPEHCRGRQPVDDGVVGWVHMLKTGRRLTDAMVHAGLAVLSPDRSWIGMHPRLAAVYLAALAERVSQANNLPVVTDQVNAYGILNGWTIDTLAQALLSDETDEQPLARTADDVAALYAAVAVQTVVPQGLENVPAIQIVKIRRMLAAEFDAFGEHIDSLAATFAELAEIESVEVLRARLQVLVERDLRRPTANLERELRRLGYEPARAVLGIKSLELPAVTAAAAAGAGVPAVAGQAGLVAARIIASGIRARRAAQDQRRAAAGYLLGLREELNPKGVLDRIRRTFRRATLGSAR
jgi:hypothetical protein